MSRTRHHGAQRRRMTEHGHGWWWRMLHEKKNRRKAVMVAHDIVRSGDVDSTRDWPRHRRPHWYFW